MVLRVKPWKGNPYWEKDTLSRLGFEEKVKIYIYLNRKSIYKLTCSPQQFKLHVLFFAEK